MSAILVLRRIYWKSGRMGGLAKKRNAIRYTDRKCK